MKKLPIYFTVFILIIIAIGYFKNSVSLFFLMVNSKETMLFDASNWKVTSIQPDLQATMQIKPGDSLIRVGQNTANDFVSLDNELVSYKGKTVEIGVLRGGLATTVTATVPQDFQSYLKEKRVTFSSVDSGNPHDSVMTPFLRSQLLTAEVILSAMGIFSLITAALISSEKKVAWLCGSAIVAVGLLGAFEYTSTMTIFGHAIFFIILAISLVASYDKEKLTRYLGILLRK